MNKTNDIGDIQRVITDFAGSLMAVGAPTTRVVRCSERLAHSQGYDLNILIFPKTLTITLTDQRSGEQYTSVSAIRPRGLNFEMIQKLSRLSWDALDNQLTTEQIRCRHDQIVSSPRYNRWLVLLLASLANLGFCRLFDGNLTSMLIVFVATAVGFFVKQELMARHVNELAVFTLSALVASLVGSSDYMFFHGGTEDISLGTSVLFLIPGVPLINATMDIIDHHVLNGIARLANALMLIVCISVGLTITLMLTHTSGILFTHVSRPDLLTATLLDGLFAAVAGVGFAIISNPPVRSLLISGLLAFAGHAMRYFLVHNDAMPIGLVVASAVAGFVIGMLALPFATWLHCPAECFAFPSLLPMVPGMYAYKAVRDIFNVVTLPQSETIVWASRLLYNASIATLVMVMMVVGCVMPIFMFSRQAFSVTRGSK